MQRQCVREEILLGIERNMNLIWMERQIEQGKSQRTMMVIYCVKSEILEVLLVWDYNYNHGWIALMWTNNEIPIEMQIWLIKL